MIRRPSTRDIAEIFGHSPIDLSDDARSLWKLGGCPFTGDECTKHNHDKTVIYGTCSVTTPSGEDVVICPNRLYADSYSCLKQVTRAAFGQEVRLVMFREFLTMRSRPKDCVVALGQRSGKEVNVARRMSMDWILVRFCSGKVAEYLGIEVQSIDITGNYRDTWYAYKSLRPRASTTIPSSGHGLNWANVHKRLIPQLIRKGLVLSKSKYVHKGLFFIVPDVVYRKFESLLGHIPTVDKLGPNTLTIHTYALGPSVDAGNIRDLVMRRHITLSLSTFAERFISGAHLPTGEELDAAVFAALNK